MASTSQGPTKTRPRGLPRGLSGQCHARAALWNNCRLDGLDIESIAYIAKSKFSDLAVLPFIAAKNVAALREGSGMFPWRLVFVR